MNGEQTIVFDTDVFYLEDDINDAFSFELMPGRDSDISKLNFRAEVESYSSSKINVKFRFDDPLQVSQNRDPERIKVVINMSNFTNSRDEEIIGLLNMTSFIPRQMKNDWQASLVESTGDSVTITILIVGIISFTVTILLAASHA